MKTFSLILALFFACSLTATANQGATATLPLTLTWAGADQSAANAERARDVIFFLYQTKLTDSSGQEFLVRNPDGTYALDGQGRPQFRAGQQAAALTAIQNNLRDYFKGVSDAGEVNFTADAARTSADAARKARPKP